MPRATAFAGPPAGETWAPISIGHLLLSLHMRVRFAPSPTGALHVGGARTALYNWLLARGGSGTLVLRIEDTDRERSTPENVAQILDALQWLGIDFDEGPISQVARSERHQELLQRLLDEGHAYRSNATKADVDAFKAQHGAQRGYRGEDEGSAPCACACPTRARASCTTSSAATRRSPMSTSTIR